MYMLKQWILLMLDAALGAYLLIVFVYCLVGWFITNREAGWYVFLRELVEPVLSRIRRLTRYKLFIEHIDLSPIALFFIILLLRHLLSLLGR